MNHLRFKGNHYEIGYRWGSLLAGHGNYILDQVPFPITEERIAFGRQCRPVYEKFFPEILEEIRGLSEGQKSSSEKLQAVLFSMYASGRTLFLLFGFQQRAVISWTEQ